MPCPRHFTTCPVKNPICLSNVLHNRSLSLHFPRRPPIFKTYIDILCSMIPFAVVNLFASHFANIRASIISSRRLPSGKNLVPSNATQGNSMGPQSTPSFMIFLLLLVMLVLPVLILMPSIHHFTSQNVPPIRVTQTPITSPGLNIITLNYLQPNNYKNINHNCRMISDNSVSNTGLMHMPHRFIVYTDNMTNSYCHLCECRLFEPYNCPCAAGDDACNGRNACEKLYFITDMVNIFDEFVFLDNDLIILQPSFFPHLFYRSRQHDFLASYGHDFSIPQTYYRNFNSGLFFIRRNPSLNYTLMRTQMYDLKSDKDQSIISWFVQTFYTNWDSLSYKWHCRFLHREKQDIPPGHCYTLHDKSETDEILHEINMTRLTIDV